MALEDLTGTNKFIGNLVNTNPLSADDRREGDDHIRGIKNVLLNSFPKITSALDLSSDELEAAVPRATNAVQKTGDSMSGPLNVGAAVGNSISFVGLGLNTGNEAYLASSQSGAAPQLPLSLYGAGINLKATTSVQGNVQATGQLSGNSLELDGGPLGTYIDFKVAAVDFDVRLSVEGGSADVLRLYRVAGGSPMFYVTGDGGGLGFANVANSAAAGNKVAFGWRADGKLGLRVDTTQFGAAWPIDVTGNAATASNATNAGRAENLQGYPAASFCLADNTSNVGFAGGNSTLPYMRFQSGATIRKLICQDTGDDSAKSIMLQGVNPGVNAHFVVSGASGAFGVTVGYCDERVKANIADSKVDASAAIKAMRVIEFDGLEGGPHYRASFSAQNLKTIDNNLASDYAETGDGTPVWMAPNTAGILAYTVKALQEALGRIEALELLIAGGAGRA
jgi:hypothetical protein